MRLFKVIFLIALLPIACGLLAQRTAYVGIDGGVGFSKTEVDNIHGSGFQSSAFTTLAPTGVRLGIETFPQTFLELGAGTLWFVDSDLKYNPVNTVSTRWSSRSEGILAINYSARIMYRFPALNILSVSPIFGFRHTSLGQLSGDNYSRSSYLYQNGMLVWSDSAHVQSTYLPESIQNFECGLEISYIFSDHFGVSASMSYNLNPKSYKKEAIDYFQTGQEPEYAAVAYPYPRIFIKMGISYQWSVYKCRQ